VLAVIEDASIASLNVTVAAVVVGTLLLPLEGLNDVTVGAVVSAGAIKPTISGTVYEPDGAMALFNATPYWVHSCWFVNPTYSPGNPSMGAGKGTASAACWV
jgi:hypothetical protein